MRELSLNEMNLLEIGNEIGMWGAVYAGKGKLLLVPFPDADASEAEGEVCLLHMDKERWATFLQQTDVLNVELETKAIVRKSQRRIDANMQWAVWERDGYRCRYCGEKKPLSVDHVDLWEDGGATVPANLISACGPCNKTRGRMPYVDWIMRLTRCGRFTRGMENGNRCLEEPDHLYADPFDARRSEGVRPGHGRGGEAGAGVPRSPYQLERA